MNYDWEKKTKKNKKQLTDVIVILVSYWGFDMRFRMHEHVVWSYLYVSGAVDRRGYCYSWKLRKKNNKRLEIVPQKDFIISNMVTHKLRRAWQLVHVMWVYSSCPFITFKIWVLTIISFTIFGWYFDVWWISIFLWVKVKKVFRESGFEIIFCRILSVRAVVLEPYMLIGKWQLLMDWNLKCLENFINSLITNLIK